MPFSYSLLLIIVLPLTFLFIRSQVIRKRSIPVKLYIEALRNENSGHFEAAIVKYERALNEVNKIRFPDSGLRNKIIEKLKVLHTLVEYKNGLHTTHQIGPNENIIPFLSSSTSQSSTNQYSA